MKRARQEDAVPIPYLVRLTPQLAFGSKPRSREDTQHLCDLNVTHIVNLTGEEAHYMRHYTKKKETDDTFVPPTLYDEVAFPTGDALSESKQIQLYVSFARRLVSLGGASLYLHHVRGNREEALLAFLVWHLLAPADCPASGEALLAWLHKRDHRGVLRDDEDVEFYEKLIGAVKAGGGKSMLVNWLKKK